MSRTTHRTLLASVLAATAIVAVACGGGGGGGGGGGAAPAGGEEIADIGPADVTIVNFAYEPDTLTVAAGEDVVFVNEGAAPHTVTGDAFDSGVIRSGKGWVHAFDEPGTYVGQCTEYCGLSHAYMRQRVIAMPQDDFDDWLAAQEEDAEMPSEEEAAAGAELFTTQCSGCHLARGINDEEFEEAGNGEELLVSGNAPDLTHFATRGVFAGGIFDLWLDADGDEIVEADEIGAEIGELNTSALEAWLRNPPAEKPMHAPYVPEPGDEPVRGMPDFGLQEAQIDQLVAFLATLD